MGDPSGRRQHVLHHTAGTGRHRGRGESQRTTNEANMMYAHPRRSPFATLLCAVSVLLAAPASLAVDLSTSSGAQLFRQFCASCHGRDGEGNGPVAPFFKLLPPDLTLIARRSGGVFPAERVRRIVDGTEIVYPHGAREMPVWGLEFAMTAEGPTQGRAVAEATIARLVEYLRSIQKASPRQP